MVKLEWKTKVCCADDELWFAMHGKYEFRVMKRARPSFEPVNIVAVFFKNADSLSYGSFIGKDCKARLEPSGADISQPDGICLFPSIEAAKEACERYLDLMVLL